MKKLDVGQTITILANLGVIAGIVFLGVEIGQNQASLDEQNVLNRQSSRDAALENFGSLRRMLLTNDDLLETVLKQEAGEELSELEQAKWSLFCEEMIWLFGTSYVRYSSLGEYDSAAPDVANMRSLISESDSFLSCWNDEKELLRGRGFDEFVNAVDQ